VQLASKGDTAVVKPSFLDLVLLVTYIGGAVFVSRQPGYGFWDGVVWVYYVGRYIAKQYAAL
jgi:hypothetical protein